MNFDQPDGLSALLQRLQLHAEVYVNGEFCGPWAVDTSGAKHIPFILLVVVRPGYTWALSPLGT